MESLPGSRRVAYIRWIATRLFRRLAMCRRWFPVLLASVAFSSPLRAADVKELKPLVDKTLAAELPSLQELYRHLHSHPEIAFQEEQTAARLAKELRQLGFEVTTGVGDTGLVGVLKNGPGPTVMIRT